MNTEPRTTCLNCGNPQHTTEAEETQCWVENCEWDTEQDNWNTVQSAMDNLRIETETTIRLLFQHSAKTWGQPTPQNFPFVLKTWRDAYNLTTRQAGILLDCDNSAIVRYETGSRTVNKHYLRFYWEVMTDHEMSGRLNSL